MNLRHDIEVLIKQYFAWLQDKTSLKEINDQWIEITTPYLDRHNDCLQIYLKKDESGYLLTDDGYIINDLISSGCDLGTSRRLDLLKTILNGFGVQIGKENNQLIIHSSKNDFPLKKHNLLQAMLAINDLFYIAKPHTKSLFFEDVLNWFESSNVRYIKMVNFTGKSGYNHMFDFAIPKSNRFRERIVQTITNPSRQTFQDTVFKWNDTFETRPESELIALLNDSHKISASLLDAFHQYDIKTVLWSEKDKSQELFVA